MPQRGGMRHYPPPTQQMGQSGNLNAFPEANNSTNSNNQLLVTSPMNQMPPPPHQGPPHQGPSPHQSQVISQLERIWRVNSGRQVNKKSKLNVFQST